MPAAFSYERKQRILTVNNLSLSFGDKRILHDVNLQIDDIERPNMQQGQVVALLGPSGIGKTQLFRCLAGLQEPTAGKVLVTEKSIPVEAGMVGVVTQDYRLFQHRTVMGNLLVAARRRGLSKEVARSKAAALLATYGLGDRKDYYPQQLSGGQRQRVAIIQQVLCSNHFLLMDEPFSGLDPVMKDKACSTIIELSRTDDLNTTIVVTHDIESAVAIADTVWLMGRVSDAKGALLGATIRKQYDLIEMDLAWRPDIQEKPNFRTVVMSIRSEFKNC